MNKLMGIGKFNLVLDFAVAFGVTTRTIERWIKQLKEDGKIEFRGSPKKGGYCTK